MINIKSMLPGTIEFSVKEPNILIYFFFQPMTLLCSISDVLYTGGRECHIFSVFKI